jgi:hypothetical protein
MIKYDPQNPFQERAEHWGRDYVETFDAAGRLEKVKRFDAEQLRQVLVLPGIQKSVRQAAARRLKKLKEE